VGLIRLFMHGKLVIDREEGSEWGYLLVDESIRNKCFALLGLGELGYNLPDYEAHVSAFTEDEVRLLPNPLQVEGKYCEFAPMHLKVVNPEDWDEVNACVILCVECKALEHLRKWLGFEPLMYGKHEFHITIGISEDPINPTIVRVVNLFNMHLNKNLSVVLDEV